MSRSSVQVRPPAHPLRPIRQDGLRRDVAPVLERGGGPPAPEHQTLRSCLNSVVRSNASSANLRSSGSLILMKGPMSATLTR